MAEETKVQANKKLAEKVANVNQLAREQSQKKRYYYTFFENGSC